MYEVSMVGIGSATVICPILNKDSKSFCITGSIANTRQDFCSKTVLSLITPLTGDGLSNKYK